MSALQGTAAQDDSLSLDLPIDAIDLEAVMHSPGALRQVDTPAAHVELHMLYYNFLRIHSKLRMSPAIAAGASDRPWEIGDIGKLVGGAELAPKKRGPYKKKISNCPTTRDR